MKNLKIIVAITMATFLGGCANQQALPLVFGQTQTIGVGISSGDPASGQPLPDFTLGFKDKNIAVIPISTGQGSQDSDGNPRVGAVVITESADGSASEENDTLSVLGQFDLSANGKEAKVGLGKFFATGLAATKLAKGFSKALEKQ